MLNIINQQFGKQDVSHHRADVNGICIHYVSAGKGPPVELLHGWPESWIAWRKQIPVLAEKYTVIAPDLRGYGDSEKPVAGYDKHSMAKDVLGLIDHLGYKSIALIGHDRGARVATRFAKDHPLRLDRLVVLDNIPTRVVANKWIVRWLQDIGSLISTGCETYQRNSSKVAKNFGYATFLRVGAITQQ